ncbi:hypothetical protein I6J20_11555 [Corynebacterium glucuronolyticum]|nr:hypothetical protein I6J20_11555 [Corynebacterium glucuronolyticum]
MSDEAKERLHSVSKTSEDGDWALGLPNSKHVNTEWMFIQTEPIENATVNSPWNFGTYTGNVNAKYGVTGALTQWGVMWGRVSNASNIKIPIMSMNPQLDIVKYDSYENFAAPGDTVATKTTGIALQGKSDQKYQIVWKDAAGNVIKVKDESGNEQPLESAPLTVSSDGTLPSYPMTVPNDLEKVTTYKAYLYALAPDGSREDAQPLAVDSYTAIPLEKPVYTPKEVEQGKQGVNAAPKFDNLGTKPVETDDNPYPENSHFEIDEANLPEGVSASDVSIDKATGVVTLKKASGKPGSTINIPVKYVVEKALLDENKKPVLRPEYKPGTGDLLPDNQRKPVIAKQVMNTVAPFTITAPTQTDADKYTPKGKEQTVEKGKTPEAKDSIENLKDLPEGTKVAFKDPVDTSTTGDKSATVVVTYPDKSTDEVPVTVKVTDPVATQTDADKYTPKGKEQTVEKGKTPEAKDSIENLKDLPEGTKVAFKDPVDTSTTGDKSATVVVTYPDKSTDEVPVTVKVTDPVATQTDADKYTPKGKEQTVEKGKTPEAKDSIENLKDLPEGTKVAFKDPVDTSTTGDKSATVVVTYPDKSTDEVPVTVKVTDPVATQTDADKYTPKGKEQTVEKGKTPEAKDSIENLKDLPEGTKVAFKDPVDTSTTGDKSATVVVTYPDKSTDEVPVTVKVTDPVATQTDADKYTPKGKEQTVEKGKTPEAKDSIENLKDLPEGTKVAFKDPVDTSTTGDKSATVVVTYPDKSTDEVPVTVKVTDPVATQTDADKYTPKGKEQTVEKGKTPEAKDSIENLKDLPEGTKVAFKDPVDTSTTGDKSATVVVTYPDGSTDEVTTKINVKDPDKVTPPTIIISNDEKTISGKTDPGAEVTVTIPGVKDPVKVIADENGNYKVEVPEGTTLKNGDTVKVTAKVEGKGEASNSAKISKSETSDSSIDGLTQDQANKCVGASAASAIPLLLLTPIALGLAMDNQQVKDLTAGFGKQLEDINTGIQKTLGIYNPELAQQFKVQVAPHLQNLALAAGFVASIALLAGVAATQCVPGGGSSDNTTAQK